MERTVTCATLSALIADRAEIMLLDVRRRPAFDADPVLVPGAIWKDPEQVMTWAVELNRDHPVVAYCAHGHEVSRGVVDRLRAAGIEAALLEGGIEAWKASGGAVTRTALPNRQVDLLPERPSLRRSIHEVATSPCAIRD